MDVILAARDQEVSNAGQSSKAQKTSDEQSEPERPKGGSDDRQSDAQKSDKQGMNWWDVRRQRVVDQGLPIEEAADDHPRQADYEVDDEALSQDPGDWPGPYHP